MAGVLIYSDPADDGALAPDATGGEAAAAVPNGPFRPKWGVQRGSVFIGEGDPLTPGRPAVPGM